VNTSRYHRTRHHQIWREQKARLVWETSMNAVRHSWLYGRRYNSVDGQSFSQAPAFAQDLTSARLPRDPPPAPPRPPRGAATPLIGVGPAMAGTACWRSCLFADFGGMTKATYYKYMIGARQACSRTGATAAPGHAFGLLSHLLWGTVLRRRPCLTGVFPSSCKL
jgi:hypothetical protein